jgi:predicted Na+-dependent transporter
VGFNVILLLVCIPFLPLAVAALGKLFGREVSIGMGAVAGVVVPTQLLPLALGLLIARLRPRLAARLIRPVTMLGNVLLGALALVLIVALAKRIVGVGATGLVAAFLLAAAGVTIGHLFGGRRPQPRLALAAFSALRFPALALLLATKLPAGPRIVPAIFAYLLVSAAVLGLYYAGVRLLARRRGGEAGPRPVAPEPVAA